MSMPSIASARELPPQSRRRPPPPLQPGNAHFNFRRVSAPFTLNMTGCTQSMLGPCLKCKCQRTPSLQEGCTSDAPKKQQSERYRHKVWSTQQGFELIMQFLQMKK